MKSLRLLIAIPVLCSAFSLSLLTTGCSSKDVAAAADEVVTDGTALVAALKAELPAGDTRLAGADKFLAAAQAFKTAFVAAGTSNAQAGLLPLLANVTSAFRTAILPLVAGQSTNASLLAVAVDAGLRIIAAHFSKAITTIQSASGRTKAVLRSSVSLSDSDLQQAASAVNDYLSSPQLVAPKH
jgi:hypothetical protein